MTSPARITDERLRDSHWFVVRAVAGERILFETVVPEAQLRQERAAMRATLKRKGFEVVE